MAYAVAVRALCEFTAKQGDLDARFTPSPSAQEGIEGHAWVTARRGPSYESELSLSGEYRQLPVRGRADGYDSADNRLDEIKTHRGRLDRQPGFDYTYLYPGLQEVVQAAGRVIRTPSDRGVVHLVDDRFMRPSVRRLLPGWWGLD